MVREMRQVGFIGSDGVDTNFTLILQKYDYTSELLSRQTGMSSLESRSCSHGWPLVVTDALGEKRFDNKTTTAYIQPINAFLTSDHHLFLVPLRILHLIPQEPFSACPNPQHRFRGSNP